MNRSSYRPGFTPTESSVVAALPRKQRGIGPSCCGLTLIELSVIGGIIVLLVGLLIWRVTATLQAVASRKNHSATQFDVGKLGQSTLVANKQYANSTTMPGCLVLCNNTDVYRNPAAHAAIIPKGVTQLDLDRSKAALRKMFGERFITNGQVVNWDGTGNPNSILVLEGHQCLVFYLGGIADTSVSPPTMTGFSTDPVDPTAVGGERIGPFYDFERNRLETSRFGTSARFPAYNDRYGNPFAYFGGTGGANSYVGGCSSIGIDSAYPDGLGGFMNPTGFQIISAGKDRTFGDPAMWNPITGVMDDNARDDVRNF